MSLSIQVKKFSGTGEQTVELGSISHKKYHSAGGANFFSVILTHFYSNPPPSLFFERVPILCDLNTVMVGRLATNALGVGLKCEHAAWWGLRGKSVQEK